MGCAVSTSSTETRSGRGRDLPGAHALAVEQLERLVERLAQRAALALDLAATANTVVLLGDVREVEVDGEGPQHDRLRVDVELRDGLTERPGRARVAATPEPGKEADPLLEAEDVVALLLGEHTTEDLPEQAHVRPEREVVRVLGGRAHRPHSARSGPREGWRRR